MRFTLTVEMDNAAFEDDAEHGGPELARILGEVTAQVATYADAGTVRDYNGNTVGQWEVSA